MIHAIKNTGLIKRILFFTLVLTSASLSSFTTDPIDKISEAVTKSFGSKFHNAQNAEWTIKSDFIRVKFTQDNQVMYAYYKEDGALMAVTRNITRAQLPIALRSALEEKYADYYVADLFEVLKDGNSVYYAVVNKSNCSITLEALSSGSWRVFKKQKL